MTTKENEMVSLHFLINEYFNKKEVCIPLLQRNYKWSEEAAATLSQDLWDAYNNDKDKIYTIGMITIYDEPMIEQKAQLIDGQQRIVTLTLLLKHLDKARKYFKFSFERDDELNEEYKREFFIENNLMRECIPESMYVDTSRFKRNYDAIALQLTCADVERVNCQVNKLDFGDMSSHSITEIIKELELENLDGEILTMLCEIKDERQVVLKLKQLLLTKRIFSFIGVSQNISFDRIFNVIERITKDDVFFNKDIVVNSNEKEKRNIAINKYVCEIRKEILRIKDIEVELNERTQEYIEYILNKVEILFHLTTSEPIDEFLNINKNKTRFVISDFIKANLIIDTKHSQKKRKEIISLFNELSNYLFKEEDNQLWNLIKQGYSIEKDENRLKILFCDRYYHNNKKGYVYELEYERLSHYKLILKRLLRDIQLDYWSAYNGFNCLYLLKNRRFFEIFELIEDNNSISNSLEKMVFDNIIEDNSYLTFNYFLESQIYHRKIEDNIYLGMPSELEEGWGYIINESGTVNEFKEIFDDYLIKRDELMNNGGY